MRFLRNKEENVSKKVWFFLAYTVCFAIIAGAVFSVFIINKKSFIWVPDGLQQHFNALLYYRSWLLSILDTLVTEHNVSVPQRGTETLCSVTSGSSIDTSQER